MATTKISVNAHDYIPAQVTDSRSPCPALNVLANHGILPRDGRNISTSQFVRAIRQAYNLSIPLALLLAIGGLLRCGRLILFKRTLDLSDLARHNKIEHDASLVHADCPAGHSFAPTEVDRQLLDQMLGSCPASGMSRDDFAQLRARRETANARDAKLTGIWAVLGAAEAYLAWHTLKDAQGFVSRERLEQWFGEERLPDGWARPTEELGFVGLQVNQSALRKNINDIKAMQGAPKRSTETEY